MKKVLLFLNLIMLVLLLVSCIDPNNPNPNQKGLLLDVTSTAGTNKKIYEATLREPLAEKVVFSCYSDSGTFYTKEVIPTSTKVSFETSELNPGTKYRAKIITVVSNTTVNSKDFNEEISRTNDSIKPEFISAQIEKNKRLEVTSKDNPSGIAGIKVIIVEKAPGLRRIEKDLSYSYSNNTWIDSYVLTFSCDYQIIITDNNGNETIQTGTVN